MRILLTGANGYIGRRLLPVLVQKGHEVIAVVRDQRRIELQESLRGHVTLIEADFLKPETLNNLPGDVDIAYYLLHSMGVKKGGSFKSLELEAANNFKAYAKTSSLQQIIFLSGIVNDQDLSEHLSSRQSVEDKLKESVVPVTVLRAAIIIGSGGASFEILRDLVEKLPIMVTPRWLNTRCQPISIHNVIEYLEGVALQEKAYNQTFDIGGPDVLTYKQMLLKFAQVRGLRRLIITLPVLTPRVSSYWLYFVTSTSFRIASALVDSMKNEVVVQHKGIEDVVPVRQIPYEEAIRNAFDRIAQNEVVSSWKDALVSSDIDANLLEYVQVPHYGCFIDERKVAFTRSREAVIQNVWKIGGENGWYKFDPLWRLRGFLDKMVGGVGLRRGRRSPDQLVAGDALDFWRVLVADKPKGRLLLYAEMKLPGEAWLTFHVEENKLIQTAIFRPKGIIGRMYWYAILPVHAFIFQGMANNIAHQ